MALIHVIPGMFYVLCVRVLSKQPLRKKNNKQQTMSEPLPAIPQPTTFSERFHSLIMFDCIRGSRIIETAQYAFIFGLLALVGGFCIDWLFRPLYPVAKRKRANCTKLVFTGMESLHAVAVLLLQVMVSAVLVIYIRKIGELVPFFIQLCPDKYVPHWKVKEVEGELAIALMYVGIQTSIIDTLSTLRVSVFNAKCDIDE